MGLILNTRQLFCRLLRTLEVETVCDVGSMDGSDALRFRHMLPTAHILALEANPRNFALMEADERLRRNGIRILPLAASDRGSEAPFYVVEADYSEGRDRFRRGMSSLHRRSDGSRLAEVVRVRTARLDELLAAESLHARSIALWIDTEGMALEVVRGAEAVLPSTCMLHVEVETAPLIGGSQKLFGDVEKELTGAGFVLFATDYPPRNPQFNALFIRGDLLRAKATQISCWATPLRLRGSVARHVLRFAPGKLRRKIAVLTH